MLALHGKSGRWANLLLGCISTFTHTFHALPREDGTMKREHCENTSAMATIHMGGHIMLTVQNR